MPWAVAGRGQRVEIERGRVRIDHRRAGDAHRIDIAAGKLGERHRSRQLRLPDDRARRFVERIDAVGFRRHDDQPALGARRLPIERLGIDVSAQARVEARVAMHAGRPGKGEPADLVGAQPLQRVVIGQDAGPVPQRHTGTSTDTHGRSQRPKGASASPDLPALCADPSPGRAHAHPPFAVRAASALCNARKAGLAQLVEHLICNQGVTGSSPVAGTNKIRLI